MIRTILCAALSLLMIGFLNAQDKTLETKADAVKEKRPEAAAKNEGKEGIKKDDPEAKKKQLKEGFKKEGVKQNGTSQKGRVTSIGIEGGIVKLSLEGKEYDFPITENTLATLKIAERDGKQVVVAIQLFNAADGIKQGGEKKETMKKGEQKNPSEKPVEKLKEKKPE